MKKQKENMQIASAICVMYVQLKSFGFSVNL